MNVKFYLWKHLRKKGGHFLLKIEKWNHFFVLEGKKEKRIVFHFERQEEKHNT